MVQTIKKGIERCVNDHGKPDEWDMYLPWVAMGYRITPQESTKLSPYEMMFACKPDVPSAHREKLRELLDFDDPELAAQSVAERAKLVEEFVPMAGRNLLLAQHRDTKRYALLRSGGYVPSMVNFTVGQFVYVRDNAEALHDRARPEILRVADVRPSGVVVLMGRCGTTIAVNAINCAPCHLPIKDQDALPNAETFRPRKEFACEVCHLPDADRSMLLCDSCNRGWHLFCLTPPLKTVPSGIWICPQCISAGVDTAKVKTARQIELQKYQRADTGAGPSQPTTAVGKTAPGKDAAPAAAPVATTARAPVPAASPVHATSYPEPHPPATNRSERYARRLIAKPAPAEPSSAKPAADAPLVKRGPGRPRKHPLPVAALALPNFYWSNLQGSGEALQALMPGEWDAGVAAQVANLSVCTADVPQQYADVLYSDLMTEVPTLLKLVDFSSSPSVIDMCAGNGVLAKLLSDLQLAVVANSVTLGAEVDYHFDAMQHFACCRVPCRYLNERRLYPARDAWLQRLQDGGRLLLDLDLAGGGNGNTWLVVFKSAELREMLALRTY